MSASATLEILLLEDEEDSAALTEALVAQAQEGAHLHHCLTLGDALSLLKTARFDLILTDLNVPGSKGLDTLVSIHAAAINTPVVVLTGTREGDLGTAAIKAGAEDYLVKDETYIKLLSRTIRYAIERKKLTEELRIALTVWQRRLTNNPAVLYVIPAASKNLTCSDITDNLENLTGYTAEEYLSDPKFWIDHLHPEDRDGVDSKCQQVLGTGHAAQRYRFRTKNGDYHWFRDESWLVYDDAGSPQEIVGYLTDITERLETLHALKDSEERFRAVIENSPMGILLKDRDGRYTVANRAAAELNGYEHKVVNLIGKTAADIAPPDIAARVQTADQKVASERCPIVEEFAVPQPDGGVRHILTHRFPVLASDGTVTAIGAMETDITRQVEETEQLRRAAELARQAEEIAKLGHWVWDELEYRPVYLSWGAPRLRGLSEEQYREKKTSLDADVSFIYSDDKAMVRSSYERLRDQSEPYSIEYREVNTDGTIRWVHEIARPYEQEGERTRLSIGTTRDITEQKELELALRNSEEQFRVLFEQSPLGVAVTDYSSLKRLVDKVRREGADDFHRYFTDNPSEFLETLKDMTVSKANHAYLAAFGAESLEDYLALPTRWSHEAIAYFMTEIATLASNNMVATGEMRETRLDGTEFVARYVVRVLKGHEDTWSQVITLQEDITEQVHLELDNRHIYKMTALGELAAGIAHNFNNLLQPILGLTERVKDSLTDDSEAERELKLVLQATRQAKGMVAEIMAFARETPSQRESTDTYEFLNDSLGLVRETLPSSITLREKLAKDAGTIQIDSSQINGALLGVIANAYDAIKPEAGTITISLMPVIVNKKLADTVPEMTVGPFVKIAVSDTGKGMDEATMKRMFEPFFTTKHRDIGTGLGLSTAYGIITDHGGAIRAESTPGKGSTFEIYLPVTKH